MVRLKHEYERGCAVLVEHIYVFFLSLYILEKYFENTMIGKYNLLVIICDGTLTRKQKNSTGKQQNQGGESALNSNLVAKEIFLAGHPFTLVGQRFSGLVTGGCSMQYYFKRTKFLNGSKS